MGEVVDDVNDAWGKYGGAGTGSGMDSEFLEYGDSSWQSWILGPCGGMTFV